MTTSPTSVQAAPAAAVSSVIGRPLATPLSVTEKPVSDLWPLIDHLCPEGGLVLDPFCGSGSTLVAAQESHRDFLGIELDDDARATAVKRPSAAVVAATTPK